MSPISIAETKLAPPWRRSAVVERPALQRQLDELIEQRRLTLISAHAGAGKTTLAASLVDGPRPLAWISLDGADDDPLTFTLLLNLALAVCQADDGQAVAQFMATVPDAAEKPAQLLALLLNSLPQTAAQTHVLVIDDYHLLGDRQIERLVWLLAILYGVASLAMPATASAVAPIWAIGALLWGASVIALAVRPQPLSPAAERGTGWQPAIIKACISSVFSTKGLYR